MANPTTNFGWQMPTSTDLVTDLPADFEVFGQAVDTSLADLKGGTTGQVLAKASNTNMDFTWVAQDDSNAIQNSIVDAKGDLIAASANDTPARLAVGNNGETLVADSSTSTGLRYTAGTVQANPILNSSFQVWQRGTANITGGYAYTADRWQKSNDTYFGVSRQVTGDTTNLPNIQYCARVQRTAGSTVTTAMQIAQSIESVNSIPFAGKTATISFYARAGANYSATSNALAVFFNYGTGTDQNILSGYTGGANVVAQTATLTTTWQRFSYTGSVPSTATEMGCFFQQTPTGTAGANDYFEVTGVQIDIGSVALPFRTYAGTIQGELAACQRYYYRTANMGDFTLGSVISTTQVTGYVYHPVTMRSAPTVFDVSNVYYYDSTVATQYTTGTVTAPSASVNGAYVRYTHGTAVFTTGRAGILYMNGYYGFGAEL
jgi:hypothetical protein